MKRSHEELTSKMADELVIRTLTIDDIDTAIRWAAEEGWDPGVRDKRAFLSMDNEAFLGGFLGDELVACISIVIYDEAFAFLGFFIVNRPHRGRGFGFGRLWAAALARAGEGRVVGLDGVVEQQANYQRSGFSIAHKNIRFGGGIPEAGSPQIACLLDHGARSERDVVSIVQVSETTLLELFQRVADYDARVFPSARAPFLHAWLSTEDHVAWVASEGGQTAGYVVARPTLAGAFKIGPLFADNIRAASALLLAVLQHLPPGTRVFLDAPASNIDACKLAAELSWEVCFETASMYKGDAPPLSPSVWGVASFELG